MALRTQTLGMPPAPALSVTTPNGSTSKLTDLTPAKACELCQNSVAGSEAHPHVLTRLAKLETDCVLAEFFEEVIGNHKEAINTLSDNAKVDREESKEHLKDYVENKGVINQGFGILSDNDKEIHRDAQNFKAQISSLQSENQSLKEDSKRLQCHLDAALRKIDGLEQRVMAMESVFSVAQEMAQQSLNKQHTNS